MTLWFRVPDTSAWKFVLFIGWGLGEGVGFKGTIADSAQNRHDSLVCVSMFHVVLWRTGQGFTMNVTQDAWINSSPPWGSKNGYWRMVMSYWSFVLSKIKLIVVLLIFQINLVIFRSNLVILAVFLLLLFIILLFIYLYIAWKVFYYIIFISMCNTYIFYLFVV